MRLTLIRDIFTDKSTTGRLLINGEDECYTLEDPSRPIKIAGTTGIPEGVYEVTITFSNRFQKRLPLLKNVPGFEGIRIHSGNKAEDTEGCILVGSSRSKDWISKSGVAFQALFNKLQFALASGPVFITIKSQSSSESIEPAAGEETHTDHPASDTSR